ncbi:hypothetical protein TthSNM33_08630 [Thermus thermophilus]|nr:hypothetical protein TthSNM33_08630 [Thermus thermophilus]
MKRKKPTIHDVAAKAGVGLGTVSRVLNDHPAVRPETRARVLRAMEELGYAPNPHARRIAGGAELHGERPPPLRGHRVLPQARGGD